MTEEIRKYGYLELISGTGENPLTITYNSGLSSDTALIELNSSEPRLLLKALLSDQAYIEATAPIRYTLFIYILLACISALVMSIIFARLNIRPLEAVVEFISQLGINAGEYRGNAYSYIRQALTGVIHSEEQISKAYELVKNSFEHTVFNMAIKGFNIGTLHLNSALGHIPAFKGNYILVGVSGEPINDMHPAEYNPELTIIAAKRLFIENTVKPYLYEANNLYAVLNVQLHNGPKTLYELLKTINQSLMETLGVRVCFGVSQEFSTLSQLEKAANQVLSVLSTGKKELYPYIIRYDQQAHIGNFQMHLDEDMLARLLVQDESEPLCEYLKSLQRTICGKSQFSLVYLKTFYYSVLAVYQKVLQNISQDDKIILKEYDLEAGTDDNIHYLYEVGMKLHYTALDYRKKQSQDLSQQVLMYIKQNYSSSSLSLTMVADNFQLSERYVSSLVREQTGYNYYDHVKKIRITQARYLLAHTETPINDIAGCVGYDLPNSFYKLFKNQTGLSPKKYRECAVYLDTKTPDVNIVEDNV
jgi:AraC-like DNA-binding protein